MGDMTAVIKRWYQVLDSSAELEAMLELCHPDVEFRLPGPMLLRGRDEVVGYIRQFELAFSEPDHEIVTIVTSANAAAVEVRTTAIHTGTLVTPAGDLEATGRRVATEGGAFYTADPSGLLTSIHYFFDRGELAEQLVATTESA